MDEATAGWDHTFTLCQRAELEADLKRAQDEMTENPSDETLAAYTALHALVHPPEEGDEPGFDETSHHKR